MLINIMEVIKKEDLIVKKTPFIDRSLWLRAQEKLVDERSHLYPTLDMCLGCSEGCKQVQVEGLGRLY